MNDELPPGLRKKSPVTAIGVLMLLFGMLSGRLWNVAEQMDPSILRSLAYLTTDLMRLSLLLSLAVIPIGMLKNHKIKKWTRIHGASGFKDPWKTPTSESRNSFHGPVQDGSGQRSKAVGVQLGRGFARAFKVGLWIVCSLYFTLALSWSCISLLVDPEIAADGATSTWASIGYVGFLLGALLAVPLTLASVMASVAKVFARSGWLHLFFRCLLWTLVVLIPVPALMLLVDAAKLFSDSG